MNATVFFSKFFGKLAIICLFLLVSVQFLLFHHHIRPLLNYALFLEVNALPEIEISDYNKSYMKLKLEGDGDVKIPLYINGVFVNNLRTHHELEIIYHEGDVIEVDGMNSRGEMILYLNQNKIPIDSKLMCLSSAYLKKMLEE
ncbi:MAG: hypothetical protein ACOX6S_11650 [Clostridia bacterium]|jgi:hypothetical protein